MTLRAFMQRLTKKIACLLVLVLALSGCDRNAPLLVVKAVAAGVPALAPFFDENSGLGKDATIRSQPARGSLQQGDTPGLYGGTKQPTICDVDKLERFLTDPRNHKKAQAWADVLEIGTDEIPEYLDRLTPVLLRHDTLVKNHDYKKEKAVPYNSLLQAGIAILVDEQGLPAVKCSCGNPLRPFEGDTSRISVEFEDGNKKWTGYERSSVVAVRPAPRTLARIALVDVQDPDRGINRPVGTTGKDDSTFDTRKRRAVPNLAGTTFGKASRQLADAGLAAGFDGKGLPPDGAKVTATDPPAGTELEFGQYVMLSVAGGTSTSGGGTTTTPPPPSGSSRPTTTTAPSSPSSSSPATPPSSSSTKPGASSSPPSSSTAPTSESPPKSSSPSSSEPDPPSSPPSTDPTTSSPPPEVTSTPPEVTSPPPSSEPVTTSAPPPTSEPATGEPSTSATT
ncbi:PASTA domain-containing protein [Streptomyces fulvoviolaceus]|nr:PASTA domain-containing protein [Streptomyces fulvoviolaceus]